MGKFKEISIQKEIEEDNFQALIIRRNEIQNNFKEKYNVRGKYSDVPKK